MEGVGGGRRPKHKGGTVVGGVGALALPHHRHNNRYNARHKSERHNGHKWLCKVPRRSSGRWSRRSSASATRWSPQRGAGTITCLCVCLFEDFRSVSSGVRPPGYLMGRNKASATPSQGLALWNTRIARGGRTNCLTNIFCCLTPCDDILTQNI